MSALPGPARRTDDAGRAALALYADSPPAVRAHVHIRWWSAPFAPVADALPTSGRILEIGCGHGLFAAYAALREPGRTVVGVDIDEEKIRHAQVATLDGRLSFAVGESGAVPAGPWDAVAFVDMLYLLPADAQRQLLTQAAATLVPGGRMVIKEMGTRPAWKVRWNTWQETLSVKVLRITAGSSFDFVPPETMAGWLQDAGLRTKAQRLDRGTVHPHHLLLAERPG